VQNVDYFQAAKDYLRAANTLRARAGEARLRGQADSADYMLTKAARLEDQARQIAQLFR